MGVDVLLRALRVVGSLLAFRRNYRAAAVLGLVVACGWLFLSIRPASAHGGPRLGVPGRVVNVPGPIGADANFGLWLTVAGVLLLGVVLGALINGLRYSGEPVSGDLGPGNEVAPPRWLRPAGGPYFRPRRLPVGE